MFTQIQKLVAGAFCALILAAGAVAPAHAHELASGRAGQIQNLQFKGNPTLARMIAAECVGLIHIIAMHHEEEETRIDWTVLSRDGKRTVVVAAAEVDESDTIVAQGEIVKGAFRGAKISARGYLKGDMFLIDLKMSLGDLEVGFTQVLEPLEETGQ
jgi:hypothetical protein